MIAFFHSFAGQQVKGTLGEYRGKLDSMARTNRLLDGGMEEIRRTSGRTSRVDPESRGLPRERRERVRLHGQRTGRTD